MQPVDAAANVAVSTLDFWGNVVPIINCVLLVFALAGLIALHVRMRMRK